MTSEVFTQLITVPKSAIDARGHVNNVTYLEWCLNAAEAHWIKNTSETLRKNYVWYVLRHEINYKAAAFEGETLQVSTWVTLAEGVKSERHYRIERSADDKALVEAKSLWCLLNGKTLRPTKITEEIRNLF